MLAPELIECFCREFEREYRAIQKSLDEQHKSSDQKLRKLDKQISRLVKAVENGGEFDSIRERLEELEQEKAALRAITPPKQSKELPVVKPDLIPVYQKKVARLENTLTESEELRQQAIPILRSLVDKIVLHPGEGRGNLRIELHGQLAAIPNLTEEPVPEEVMIKVVAEEGLEPPTRGL